MISKKIDTSVDIAPLLAARWSGVAFDSGRAVPNNKIEAMLEAARWAPSCYNDQPWRFIVCSKQTDTLAWNGVFDSLMELNQGWCQSVPVLIVVVANILFSHNGQPNPCAIYDAGAASLSACLQGAHEGVMTHQMAGFHADKLRLRFSIPENMTPLSIIAAGYSVPAESIPGLLREKELSPRTRKPLEEIRSYGNGDIFFPDNEHEQGV